MYIHILTSSSVFSSWSASFSNISSFSAGGDALIGGEVRLEGMEVKERRRTFIQTAKLFIVMQQYHYSINRPSMKMIVTKKNIIKRARVVSRKISMLL